MAPEQAPARRSSPFTADGSASLALSCIAFSAAAVVPLLPSLLATTQGYHVTMTILHAIVCGLGVALSLTHGLRPLLMVASVFPYCWLVVPGAFQVAHQVAAWGDVGVTTNFELTLQAQGVLLLGQLSLLVAYLVTTLLVRGGSFEEEPAARTPPPLGRLPLLARVSVLAAVALAPLAALAVGGVGALFSSRQVLHETAEAAGADASAVGDLFRVLPIAFATVATLLAFRLLRHPAASHRDRWTARCVLTGAVLVLLVVANPFSSTRFLVLTTFGTLAMIALRPLSRRAAWVMLGISLTVCLLLYPLANFFRSRTLNPPDGYLLATPDFDGFQQAVNAIDYVQHHGIAWGSHLSSGLLFFIPRGLWEGKATQASLLVAEWRGYTFVNLSLPLPSEAYIDLGWPGVVLVLGLVGALWAVLDVAWRAGSTAAALAAFLAVSQVGLWRGPFGSQYPVIGLTLGLLVVVLYLLREREAAPPTSHPSGAPGPKGERVRGPRGTRP